MFYCVKQFLWQLRQEILQSGNSHTKLKLFHAPKWEINSISKFEMSEMRVETLISIILKKGNKNKGLQGSKVPQIPLFQKISLTKLDS